jgi:hypothetical protein
MRVFAIATILLLTSSPVPSFAQSEEKSPVPAQPQTVPVQPERNPQSQQSREEDRDRGEDRQVGRDWRAHPSDSDSMGHMGQMGQREMGPKDMGRMKERMGRDMDSDHRTAGRDWRARPDDEGADRDRYSRGYSDEDRPRRRVKICFEYENGDEYCHYR